MQFDEQDRGHKSPCRSLRQGTMGKRAMSQTDSLAKDFCQHTTAHGWGRVTRSHTRCMSVFWAVLTVAALASNAGHITLLVGSYLSFQTEIRWQIKVSEIQFPSITVCNSQAMSTSTRKEMLKDNTTRLHSWQKVIDNLDNYDGMVEAINRSAEFERIKFKLREPSGYFQNIGGEYKEVGHQIKDFILGCTYAMENCSEFNFTQFYTQDYFNCYTFNSGHDILVAKTTGPMAGLSLVLYLENESREVSGDGHYNMFMNTGDTAGIRVVVHSPNSRPYPGETGFDVAPGMSASVSMVVQLNTWLDKPYGDCIDHEWPTAIGQYRFNYTMNDCLLLCKQLHVLRTCGCVSAFLPLPLVVNAPYCGKWKVNNSDDLEEFIRRVTCEDTAMLSQPTYEMIEACGCQPSCEVFQYKTDVSFAHWPTSSSQSDFYQRYVLDRENATSFKAYTNLEPVNTTVERGMITKNFARLNVYLQEPIVNIHSQRASYSLPKLASDVGGTFGLWIGMSLITWCEVVEFFGYMIVVQIKKARTAIKSVSLQKSAPCNNDKEVERV